ncbi:MAG: prefoldin subunit [Candidatus Woesearchaeota archaeon]
MNKETEEKINKLAMFEQNSQKLLNQKYAYQNELLEIESALEELKSSSSSYRILGNVMIKSDSKKIKADLDERKELIASRIKSIESQEKNLFDQVKKLQSEVMNELDG